MPTSGTGKGGGRTPPRKRKPAAKKPAARKPRAKQPPAAEPPPPTDIATKRKGARRPRKLGEGAGRHTSMTEEVVGQLLQTLRQGANIPTAAAFARVNLSSVYRWLERGAKEQGRIDAALLKGEEPEHQPEEEPFRDFREQVDYAMAAPQVTAEITVMQVMSGKAALTQLADGTQLVGPVPMPRDRLRAASYFLDRKAPDFMPRQVAGLEVSGGPDPIKHEVVIETAEEIRRQEAAIAEVFLQSRIVLPALPPEAPPEEGT